MSRHLVEQINKYVGQEDILFHLGDWSFGGINNIWNFRKQIICHNIHLVLGNHDHHIKKNSVLPNNTFLDVEIPSRYIFTTVNDYLEIFIDGQMYCLCHYPMSSWNDRHRASIMLHGHEHGNNVIIPKRIDVGIDNAFKLFGEYKPFNVKDVRNSITK